jgi:hypothetical protein
MTARQHGAPAMQELLQELGLPASAELRLHKGWRGVFDPPPPTTENCSKIKGLVNRQALFLWPTWARASRLPDAVAARRPASMGRGRTQPSLPKEPVVGSHETAGPVSVGFSNRLASDSPWPPAISWARPWASCRSRLTRNKKCLPTSGSRSHTTRSVSGPTRSTRTVFCRNTCVHGPNALARPSRAALAVMPRKTVGRTARRLRM